MSGAIDIAKGTIRSGAVDILVAQYVSGGAKCGELTTTDQDAMCAYLDQLQESMTGDFRVTLSSSKVNKKRGHKPVAQQPFEYVIKGLAGRTISATPPAQNVSTTARATELPLDVVHKSGMNEARAQTLEEIVAELRSEVEELRAELDEADEEAEELAATMNAAPPPPPLPFFATEAGGQALVKLLTPVSEAAAHMLTGLFTRKAGAPPAQRQVKASADDITDEEKRLIAAARNYQRENPEQAAIALSTLMDNYAAIPDQPGTDGE